LSLKERAVVELSGKSALITGAGRGIGREIASVLVEAGCDVGISDIDLDTARATAEELGAKGRKTLALKANVAVADEVSGMFSAFLAEFGKVDILVNNAGITRDGLAVRMKEEDWDAVLDINLKSAFLCCREAARPMMKARNGRIVNIASVVGLMGNAGQANYAASKAGLIGLTKTLAKELATRSVNVNAVAPGFIQTAMTDKLSETERERLAGLIPMQKLGTARDVANVVLFLCSPLAAYVTGQVVTVDGGLVM
jgi:3-oxoacyl-[acyl-carrier protein] reductase